MIQAEKGTSGVKICNDSLHFLYGKAQITQQGTTVPKLATAIQKLDSLEDISQQSPLILANSAIREIQSH